MDGFRHRNIYKFLRRPYSEKEHPNMEDYFNSKIQLFKMCKSGFINVDNIYHIPNIKIVQDCDIKTYGIDDNPANLLAKDITVTNTTADFKVKIGDRNERIKLESWKI